MFDRCYINSMCFSRSSSRTRFPMKINIYPQSSKAYKTEWNIFFININMWLCNMWLCISKRFCFSCYLIRLVLSLNILFLTFFFFSKMLCPSCFSPLFTSSYPFGIFLSWFIFNFCFSFNFCFRFNFIVFRLHLQSL